MKRTLWLAALAALALAETVDHPTGPRITPPTINSVSPAGVSRGTTVEIVVEGLNLAQASATYFSEPGLAGRILRVKELPDLPEVRLGSNNTPSTVDLGPLPPRNQVRVEVDVSPDADVGPVSFRLLTPLGTSPAGTILIEPYYGESPDREPNDTPENAFETFLPTVLAGTISRAGDVDYFKIQVKAGEQLVFSNGAVQIGSTLQPVVTLLAEDQSVAGEYGYDGGESASHFAHRFEKAGTYYIRVSDYQQSGRGSHTYRIMAGQFPLALSAYPLGLRSGSQREVTLRGYNLGAERITVKGEPSPEAEKAAIFRVKAPSGNSFNEVELALGDDPEIESNGGNRSAATAQSISLPVTVNGRIDASNNGTPAENYFRFKARKGQKLVIDVNARRLGSELDSMVEVLDGRAKGIERATVRAAWETSTVLADRDSAQRGLRLQSWAALEAGDYLMAGSEIMRVESLPLNPDADVVMEAFGGQRLSYFDTTAEAQGVDRPVYKVQIHPPGTQFSPNGLPLVRLEYRNDDGGPGWGRDSLLHFTAPTDGDYLVRLRDVRGMGGRDFAYRLTVREPRPDFRLSISPRNPNIPRGGSVPLTATAFRIDDYDGPIEVSLADLPAGLRAAKGIIAAGQTDTTILLSAEPDARLDQAAPLRVSGRANIGGREAVHFADPGDRTKLIALMPKPDIVMMAETKEVVLEPGGTAELSVGIQRQNGFGGRVPVQVRNLPPRVRVLDVGLNGVLINEDETRRSFAIEALASAEPVEQLIYVAGVVETRSPLPSVHAAVQPVLLKVKPRQRQVALSSVERSSAAK